MTLQPDDEELLPPALASRFDLGAAGVLGALALAWFLDFAGIGLLMQLTFHELGHAAASWLAGRWAIPVPIAGLTWWGESRSGLVSAVVAAAWSAVAALAWARRLYGTAAVAAAGVAAAAYLAFAVPDATAQMWGIWAGVGGEMILPALAMGAFVVELPERARWDFWRYPLLVAAACSWLASASLWSGTPIGLAGWSLRPGDAAHDPRAYLEWLANTPGDNDQDAYRLVHVHGWTVERLASSYRGVAAGTLALLVVAAALGAGRPLRRGVPEP